MKTLFLIRHAKSSWKFPDLDDHDRPLNGRGERDRWRMAEYLAEQGTVIQEIHTSTAVRALTLATTIGDVLQIPVIPREALYTFGAGALGSSVRQLSNELTQVAVVGHNPAITELVNHLTRAGLANVPTSGIAAIQCDIERWSDLSSSACRLEFFVAPKLIE